jgi:formylglycine-generating enzyme required for sulfatase activity
VTRSEGARKPSYTPPESLDEYRIVKLLGSGAMGHVYLAQDSVLDRPVAVKLIAQRRPDEEARQRFLAEARALARLQHPNVVAVYRAGEVDGHPYLVTELVRGKPLSELKLPLPSELVITIGLDLARGLAAAHKRGVLHRDIKPANAIMADDGDAKLIDFGLAVVAEPSPHALAEGGARAESGEMLAGTPLYMAPETLREEPATPRSDVYALGAVLYELCAAVAPRETLPADVDEATWIAGAGEPVQRRAVSVDPRLAGIVDRCLAPAAADRFASADALADALAALLSGPSLPAPPGNPYRGLAAFEAEHRGLFFGRTAEVRAVLDRLREHALAVVTGDSGVGKSSVCRAGVLPLIAEGAFADHRSYRVVTLTPGRRPYAALLTALAVNFEIDEAAVEREGRDDPDALARALRRSLGKAQGALLFIDQAEELITLADPAEARAFSEAVARLPAVPLGVRVLVAVRGDFFTRLAALPGLGEDLTRALYLLRPLSPDGARAAITGPAAQKGVSFDPAGLVDTLTSAALSTPGGLPLLQFTLAQLWEARGEVGPMTAAHLERLGGVEGALTRHADDVLAAMVPEARAAAQRLLLSMVTPDNTRRRRAASELEADAPGPRAALEALVNGRLVVARETEGETGYELVHEALIQRWDTLRAWLDDTGASRARRERVEAAAAEWERLQGTSDLLLAGQRLVEADALTPDDLSPRARALVAASRRKSRADRGRRWALIAAGPVLVGLSLAGIRWKQVRDLDRLVARHVAEAQSAMTEGRSKKAEAETKRLRAYAAFDVAHGETTEEVTRKREEAERIWAEVLEAARGAEERLLRAGQSLEAALALDPARVAVRAAIGDVTVDRLALAEELHAEDRRADLLLRLAAYDPDGSRMRAHEAAPHLSLSSAPQGATVTLERYEDRQGRKVPVAMGVLGTTPLREVTLAGGPGSYRLTLNAPGRVEVRYPVLLGSGERFEAEVPLPAEKDAPEGYVFVPEGRFLLGSAEPEPLRKGFILASPLHEARTGAFWIARHELTFWEWIAFLGTLPEDERKTRTPSTQTGMWSVELQAAGTGWQIVLRLNGTRFSARQGEPIELEQRSRRSSLRWERLPVVGISMNDARAYFQWSGAAGHPAGARPCEEHEWERAFRGADERVFPHGNVLDADDADFDLTYGRKPLAFGPDEVGSHPISASPFGLQDMTGNAYELTTSAGAGGEVVMRGGAWYYDSTSAIAPNRTIGEPQTRDHLTGVRGCAAFR